MACVFDSCPLPVSPWTIHQVYRQTHKEKVPYAEAVRRVIAEDGLIGLFGRGLSTKIFANGMQVTMRVDLRQHLETPRWIHA